MNLPLSSDDIQEQGLVLSRTAPALAELGTVYRYERSGFLHGLLRVRGFTQDDAPPRFGRPDQMPEEIDRVLAFCL